MRYVIAFLLFMLPSHCWAEAIVSQVFDHRGGASGINKWSIDIDPALAVIDTPIPGNARVSVPFLMEAIWDPLNVLPGSRSSPRIAHQYQPCLRLQYSYERVVVAGTECHQSNMQRGLRSRTWNRHEASLTLVQPLG